MIDFRSTSEESIGIVDLSCLRHFVFHLLIFHRLTPVANRVPPLTRLGTRLTLRSLRGADFELLAGRWSELESTCQGGKNFESLILRNPPCHAPQILCWHRWVQTGFRFCFRACNAAGGTACNAANEIRILHTVGRLAPSRRWT
jgi:hypothetical protein